MRPRTIAAMVAFALATWLASPGAVGGWLAGQDAGPIITSEPPQAMVFLDDRYVGLTPVALPAARPGKHLLRLERHGYLPAVQALNLPSSEEKLNVQLQQVAEGSLQVVSDPVGAEVWIGGQLKGTTPLKIDGLAPGELPLRVSQSSYEPWTGTAVIEPGKTAQVGAKLVLVQEDFYLNAIKANPNDGTLATELAHVRLVKGNFDGATEQYERALDLLLSNRNNSNQGNRVYAELEKIYSGEIVYGNEQTVQLMRTKVREMFERLVARYPRNFELTKKLAYYWSREGDQLKAAEVYERLADNSPDDLAAFLSAGEQYVAAGKPERAVEVYKKAVQRHNANYLSYQRLGSAYLLLVQGGDPSFRPLAIENLRKAEQLCTQSAAKMQIRKALESLGEKPRD